MNHQKVYGENLEQTAARKERERKLAEKMKKFIAEKVSCFVDRAVYLLDNPLEKVQCELEGVHEESLHFVLFYMKNNDDGNLEKVILGHEMAKLPRRITAGHWNGNKKLASIEFSYCPLIGHLVEATVLVAIGPE